MFGPLNELLVDQSSVENRLLDGDRMEHKRVLMVFAVLDERTVIDNGTSIGRIYRRLGSDEQDCLCAGRDVWIRFER